MKKNKNQENTREEAIKKLSYWVVGFVVLFGLIFVLDKINDNANLESKNYASDKEKEENNSIVESGFEEGLANLNTNFIYYSGQIKTNDTTVNFEGKMENNISTVYLTNNNEVVNCVITDGQCLDNVIPFTCNLNFLDIKYLKDYLSQTSDIDLLEEDEINYYQIATDAFEIILKEKQGYFNEININEGNTSYTINLRYLSQN